MSKVSCAKINDELTKMKDNKKKAALAIAGRITLILIAYLFGVSILQLIGAYFAGINIANTEDFSEKEHLIMQCYGFIGTFSVVFLFRRYVDRRSFL